MTDFSDAAAAAALMAELDRAAAARDSDVAGLDRLDADEVAYLAGVDLLADQLTDGVECDTDTVTDD